MVKIIHLVIGGATGTIARYLLSNSVYRIFGTSFPYGTLIVNLLGCFLVGLFFSLAENKFLLSSNMRILLMVGFCGAFTTFSTFILETSQLIRDGESMRAFLNVALSCVAGFVVFRAGILIGASV